MNATYTKLRSGEWGIRVTGNAPVAGQFVTVTKRDGTTKKETVTRVLWSGDGVYLCAIAPKASSSPPKRGGLSDDDRCEVCDRNKYTCGHCVGW